MAALPGVTRASAIDEPRRRRSSHRYLCARLVAGSLSARTSAQTRPPDEPTEAQRQESGTAAAPSAASFERIRGALELGRHTDLPGGAGLGVRDDLRLADRRPAMQLFHGLHVVGGVALFRGTYGARGPVPMGGPTHWDMMSIMAPREMTEAVSSDVLGIATASAFPLVPYAIKTIARWLFGDADGDPPQHPILTESEETLAIAGARADVHVLDAGIHQSGRTVALSLVVPADTPPDTDPPPRVEPVLMRELGS